MSKLGTAIRIAAEVHEGQLDKADAPYMLHSLAVMQMVAPDEDAMIVAVLHDVFEDCNRLHLLELKDKVRHTFGTRLYEAVLAMTHQKGESYDDYIERVAQNFLASKAKVADLTHNMDPRRIPAYQIVDKDFIRWDKYRRALIRLKREA